MGVEPKPAADVDIDRKLVTALLASQMADLAELPLVEQTAGWDNSIWRLGDDLVVRLPRRFAAAELVVHEQRWLRSLAPGLPLPIPVPVRHGRPSDLFGSPWSVIEWLEGSPASETPPEDPASGAAAIGAFLAALHQVAPADAPRNPYRGIPLAVRAQQSDRYLEMIVADRDLGELDAVEIESVLRRCEAVPVWDGPAMWVHGDLHPANLLVHRGEISAVLDFGDLCSGDPATDLAIAWMLFDTADRQVIRESLVLGGDELWERGRGWAIGLSLAYLAHSADSPTMERIGRRGLAAAVSEALSD